VTIEHTRRDITRLRAKFDQAPRESALHLAQRLSWYSMQLALDNQPDASQATWVEALEVAGHVLTGPGPSQFERTELIRIGIGTARCMVQAGRPDEALEVAAKATEQYSALAAEATDPGSVLALRGAILTVIADAHLELGDADAAMDTLSEALLELLAGSGTNPLIVRQMVREPLTSLSALIAQQD
jgi:hypothetical protein